MKNKKLFIVRKYVWADNISDVLKQENKQSPDDVWIDEEWKKASNEPKDSIGFYHKNETH